MMRSWGALPISGGKYPLRLLLSNSLRKCTHVNARKSVKRAIEILYKLSPRNLQVRVEVDLHVDQIWEWAQLLWKAAVQCVVVHVPVSPNKCTLCKIILQIKLQVKTLHQVVNWCLMEERENLQKIKPQGFLQTLAWGTYKCWIDVKPTNSGGTGPEIWFWSIWILLSPDKLPSSGGKMPVNRFPFSNLARSKCRHQQNEPILSAAKWREYWK